MKQNERNFWLDSSLFITFRLTMITGFLLWLLIPHQNAAIILGFSRDFWRSVHICSGLVTVVGNVIHIIWHRDWLKALRKRPMASLPARMRAKRVVDRFIWMVFLVASGFGALDWILSMGENTITISSRLHVVFGMVWLLGIIAHLALHKKLDLFCRPAPLSDEGSVSSRFFKQFVISATTGKKGSQPHTVRALLSVCPSTGG